MASLSLVVSGCGSVLRGGLKHEARGAAAFDPLVVPLGEDGAGEADRGGAVGAPLIVKRLSRLSRLEVPRGRP